MIYFNLHQATGLTPQELAEVFQNNPRAYMAVRGAVSEKHLAKAIDKLYQGGIIDEYRLASGDMDKDFYLKIGDSWISLECKNVEVIKTTNKKIKANYIEYLAQKGYITNTLIEEFLDEAGNTKSNINTLSTRHINELFSRLPQKLRESGIAKYEYSASRVKFSKLGDINDEKFLHQFEDYPITIDFQRTRNSTDDDGDNRRNRYYKIGEIDIVGACLFSRTMEWNFLYAKAENFNIHDIYTDRYSNKLQLKPGVWTSDLASLLSA